MAYFVPAGYPSLLTGFITASTTGEMELMSAAKVTSKRTIKLPVSDSQRAAISLVMGCLSGPHAAATAQPALVAPARREDARAAQLVESSGLGRNTKARRGDRQGAGVGKRGHGSRDQSRFDTRTEWCRRYS